MSTYQELVAKKQALEKETAEIAEKIKAARASEHADVVNRIKSLMSEHGISMADLGGRGGRGKRTPTPKTGGGKVAPKYRNSATGDTWTGRGLQPKWLKALLASGRKIDEFKI
ncbi:MAG TPA: H-NS histone family protein [Methylibium sp.]|uniref:H-NS histone family protein n=1 Tax=Methylibium sp. TaxID=2067992 RepID=UPI002DBF32EE|nr:H-NS histone family protein [Methylibium sp.]HEU4457753.1 H-NS histone family protein [Methylibium sp.]